MSRNVRDDIERALSRKDLNGKITHIITAVKLPTGAVEIAINTENTFEKLEYIHSAYDEDMCLKTNPQIHMVKIMIVWDWM